MCRAFKETFASLQSAATAALDGTVFNFEADNLEVIKIRQSLDLAVIKIKACFERCGVSFIDLRSSVTSPWTIALTGC